MEINKYNVFLEVAKQKNISRAAENLGYTQSGVSHTIGRFEKEIGLKLFDRSRSGATLTSAGQELYPSIAELAACQEKVEQTIQSLHNLHQGTLTIGTFSSMAREWLPHIMRRFKEDFPSIQVHFLEGGSEDILQWLETRTIDFGLFSYRDDVPNMENMEWIPLKRDPLVALLPPDDPDDSNQYPIESFHNRSFIMSALGTDIDIHRALEEHKVTPDVQYTAKDDYTIVSLVSCGLGASILPELVLQSYQTDVKIKAIVPEIHRDLGILVPSLSLASPAALKFIEYTKDYISL